MGGTVTWETAGRGEPEGRTEGQRGGRKDALSGGHRSDRSQDCTRRGQHQGMDHSADSAARGRTLGCQVCKEGSEAGWNPAEFTALWGAKC